MLCLPKGKRAQSKGRGGGGEGRSRARIRNDVTIVQFFPKLPATVKRQIFDDQNVKKEYKVEEPEHCVYFPQNQLL